MFKRKEKVGVREEKRDNGKDRKKKYRNKEKDGQTVVMSRAREKER